LTSLLMERGERTRRADETTRKKERGKSNFATHGKPQEKKKGKADGTLEEQRGGPAAKKKLTD